MVVFVLSVKADLENVEALHISKHNRFCFDVAATDESESREGAFFAIASLHHLQCGNSMRCRHFRGQRRGCGARGKQVCYV